MQYRNQVELHLNFKFKIAKTETMLQRTGIQCVLQLMMTLKFSWNAKVTCALIGRWPVHPANDVFEIQTQIVAQNIVNISTVRKYSSSYQHNDVSTLMLLQDISVYGIESFVPAQTKTIFLETVHLCNGNLAKYCRSQLRFP